MQAQIKERQDYSPEEYLELEVASSERHEYIDGEIIPMTGGLPNHNQLALNITGALNFALRRQPYQVFVTDQRLWIPNARIHTYPDGMVMALPLTYAPNRRDTLENPVVIIEVLSKSTQDYDRGPKFLAYRTIPSFQEYILIDQYSHHVDQYVKQRAKQWLYSEYDAEDEIIQFKSLPFEISMVDLYDKVNWQKADDESS